MAIATGAFTASNIQPGTSLSFSHTIGSGADRILLVFIEGPNSDVITGVTYAGRGLKRLLYYTASTGQDHWIYGILAPPVGAALVVVTWGGSSQSIWAQAGSYTGVAGLPTITGGATNAGTATSLTLGLVSTVDNSWMVMASGVQRNPTAGTGSTSRVANDSGELFDNNGPISPAGLNNMTVTFSSIGAGGMANSGVIIEPGTQVAQPSPTFFPFLDRR